MSVCGLSHCDYTCAGCGHTWEDTKQRGYESAAYEYSGCPQCKSKDCSWKPHEAPKRTPEEEAEFQAKLHRPGSKLGKPPKEFTEQVLGRIKKHHEGHKKNKSSINTDW